MASKPSSAFTLDIEKWRDRTLAYHYGMQAALTEVTGLLHSLRPPRDDLRINEFFEDARTPLPVLLKTLHAVEDKMHAGVVECVEICHKQQESPFGLVKNRSSYWRELVQEFAHVRPRANTDERAHAVGHREILADLKDEIHKLWTDAALPEGIVLGKAAKSSEAATTIFGDIYATCDIAIDAAAHHALEVVSSLQRQKIPEIVAAGHSAWSKAVVAGQCDEPFRASRVASYPQLYPAA